MKKLFKNKIFKGVVGTLLCVCILLFAAVIGINAYMISFSKKNFVTVDELKADSYDCILVLGAGLWSGKPSPMLKERLDFSLEAYNKECSDRFLVSGDHGTKNYDEVNAMKDYLVENGISADCVYIDHAGFSTYESMYRARDVFKVQKVLIVTQNTIFTGLCILQDSLALRLTALTGRSSNIPSKIT